ncbi:MAG: VOC family protein, partial [Acidimicrobiales bacterium]
MAVLNHHIVAAHSTRATALFFSEVLDLERPVELGPFVVLEVSGDTTLDFVETEGDVAPLHYAFLVTEEEFDEIFARIHERGLTYWSDPLHRDQGAITTVTH